jgi:hypothetical protein
MSKRRKIEFGPLGCTQFKSYSKWRATAKSLGLVLVGASNLVVAQTRETPTRCRLCCGAWFFEPQRGWIVP